MELGEKIRQERQSAKLSQRQLCGDRITRNMLSQIEHGTARPSMDTLRYLAEQLGKPVSYFLEEDPVSSPNQKRMAQVRQLMAENRFPEALEQLRLFQEPEALFGWERNCRMVNALLGASAQALEQGKHLYARQLLEEAGKYAPEFPELERKRLLMLGSVPGVSCGEIVSGLPCLDEELLLRAQAALEQEDMKRAEVLLDAAERREAPRWNLLRGQLLLRQNRYAPAATCLEKAEETYPERCCPMLEICYRELGDYQKAYLYACKQR